MLTARQGLHAHSYNSHKFGLSMHAIISRPSLVGAISGWSEAGQPWHSSSCRTRSYTQAVRDVAPSRLGRPHDAHHLAALHAIVARDGVVELYPRQLRVLHLVPAQPPGSVR